MTKEQAQNKALELLGKVGLQDRAQDYPETAFWRTAAEGCNCPRALYGA